MKARACWREIPHPAPKRPCGRGISSRGGMKIPPRRTTRHFDTDRVTSNITLYAGWELSGTAEATASLVYERYGDGYAVTDVGEETEIVIPAEYEGCPSWRYATNTGTAFFPGKR